MQSHRDVADRKVDQGTAEQWLRDIGEPRLQESERALLATEIKLFDSQIEPILNGTRRELAREMFEHIDAIELLNEHMHGLEHGWRAMGAPRRPQPCEIPDLRVWASDARTRIERALQPRPVVQAEPQRQRQQQYEPSSLTHVVLG